MGKKKPDAEDEDAVQEPPVFSVDTHLFRELGNHLVGRDSTALIELVKNAYDADATEVVVTGVSLEDRESAVIVISDNGTGMTEAQFRGGFLRIAARGKEMGDKRSPVFKRRYTGAKGIGRLAAHKLAELLSVYSVSGETGTQSKTGVEATIDWNAIEECDSLDEISDEVSIAPLSLPKPAPVGTRIELSRLRRPWTREERTLFVQECQTLQAPSVLIDALPDAVIQKALLFEKPTQRLTSDEDKGFALLLEGDFDTGDPLWTGIAKTSEWVIEIDASRAQAAKKRIRYGIAPTKFKTSRDPDNETEIKAEAYNHPRKAIDGGPFFQARIFVQVDPKGSRTHRSNLRKQSGVRVYVEGFRVLPYGDEGNDWLTLDSDYTRRSPPQYAAEVEAIYGAMDEDKKWKNMILSNRSYFGAVFITQDDAGELTPLINREGFLPNAAYFRLREWVRIGIDLFVRVRAATEYQERAARKAKRTKPSNARGSAVLSALTEATEATRVLRLAATTGDTDEIATGVEGLSARISTLKDNLEEFVAETDILRVTASVGTQMGEFVHEVQSLLGTTEAVTEAIGRLRVDKAIPATKRAELATIHGTVSDMRKQLERQASYLLDIATPDASRRRSKQRLADRFDRAIKLVERAAEKRGITIRNAIPPELVSIKMFPAELTTVFANLLSNAVKNAGEDGVIQASAQATQQGILLKVQNTGTRVDVDNSERFFLPYVSTTTSVDTTLGQGMGLGLTITRKTLEEYGATIRFVPPGKQFQTAIQIVFPSED